MLQIVGWQGSSCCRLSDGKDNHDRSGKKKQLKKSNTTQINPNSKIPSICPQAFDTMSSQKIRKYPTGTVECPAIFSITNRQESYQEFYHAGHEYKDPVLQISMKAQQSLYFHPESYSYSYRNLPTQKKKISNASVQNKKRYQVLTVHENTDHAPTRTGVYATHLGGDCFDLTRA